LLLSLPVIEDVTDPDASQTILAHLKQRALLMLFTSKGGVKGRKTIALPLSDG